MLCTVVLLFTYDSFFFLSASKHPKALEQHGKIIQVKTLEYSYFPLKLDHAIDWEQKYMASYFFLLFLKIFFLILKCTMRLMSLFQGVISLPLKPDLQAQDPLDTVRLDRQVTPRLGVKRCVSQVPVCSQAVCYLGENQNKPPRRQCLSSRVRAGPR